jgi:hypothetical protein
MKNKPNRKSTQDDDLVIKRTYATRSEIKPLYVGGEAAGGLDYGNIVRVNWDSDKASTTNSDRLSGVLRSTAVTITSTGGFVVEVLRSNKPPATSLQIKAKRSNELPGNWVEYWSWCLLKELREPWRGDLLEDRDRMAHEGYTSFQIRRAIAFQVVCLVGNWLWADLADLRL